MWSLVLMVGVVCVRIGGVRGSESETESRQNLIKTKKNIHILHITKITHASKRQMPNVIQGAIFIFIYVKHQAREA